MWNFQVPKAFFFLGKVIANSVRTINQPHWSFSNSRSCTSKPGVIYFEGTRGVFPASRLPQLSRLFSVASVFVHHMGSLLKEVSVPAQRHGAVRPHGHFLPAGWGVPLRRGRRQTPQHPGGSGSVDVPTAVWWRKPRVDPHWRDPSGEGCLVRDGGSEQPPPGGHLVLHGAPERAVRRHGSHAAPCKWPTSSVTSLRPAMGQSVSMSVLHQVAHFKDEDQIVSHLAAKSASARVLQLLHQSVRAPHYRCTTCKHLTAGSI